MVIECLCGAAVTLASLFASPASIDPTAVTIGPVHIVDVQAGRIIPDQSIAITNGRIAAIKPMAETRVAGELIDGRGRYAIPGLFDCHVHINEPERDSKLMVAHGVVFARDMGGNTADRIALRTRAQAGELAGLQIKVTGTLLDGVPPYHPWSAACDTPEAGREAARDVAKAGVNQIKVYSKLKPEVHQAILDEAKQLGLRCVGHVPESMTVLQAAKAGQLTNEHLTRAESLFIPLAGEFKPPQGAGYIFGGGWWLAYPQVDKSALDQSLRELAATGMLQCPTMILNAGYARITPSAETLATWKRFIPPADVQGWISKPEQWATYVDSAAAAWPHMLDLVKRLHDTGNPILVGTDLGNAYALAGYSVHEEMLYLHQAGLSNLECLRAATSTPAKFLGMSDHGSVSESKAASFLLVDGNPLEDITNTRRISDLWIAGKHHDAAAIEGLKARAEEIAKSLTPADAPATLEAPEGEVTDRGTFNMKWQQWDVGTEDFVYTKTPDGTASRTLNRQNSFGRIPTLVDAKYRNGALTSLRWETFAATPTQGEVAFQADSKSASVRMTQGANVETYGVDLKSGSDDKGRYILGPGGLVDPALWNLFGGRGDDTPAVEKAIVTLIELQPRGGRPVESLWLVSQEPDEAITTGQNKIACKKFIMTKHKVADSPRITVWLDAENNRLVKRETIEGSLSQSATRN